jgi:hypothetical protein
MVEVFKTNLKDREAANLLVEKIQDHFEYAANFDLEDCDNILRVECKKGIVESGLLVEFLSRWNCVAQILPDNVPSMCDGNKILNSLFYRE